MSTILQLTDTQRKIYDHLCRELQNGSYNVKVPRGFPKDSAINFVKLALDDNPELINVDNCRVYFTSSLMASGISLSPVFKGADALNAKKRFDEESEKILKSIIKRINGKRNKKLQDLSRKEIDLKYHERLRCNRYRF